jgi:HEAT repeat protein
LAWDYGKIDLMKSQLRDWLADARFQRIIDTASKHRRALSTLITLTYDEDPLIHWRALDAIGRCASQMCSTRPEMLKNLLRRLFWQMSDEAGAIAWHAPETIGEIVCADPRAFAGFIPLTVSLLDLEPEDLPRFLPGILYALGRIGQKAPDSVKQGLPGILEALKEENAQTRAMAVWCLGRIGESKVLKQRPELAQDQGAAVVYKDEQLASTTVAALRAEAVGGLQSAVRSRQSAEGSLGS